jgi:hypothetical protein
MKKGRNFKCFKVLVREEMAAQIFVLSTDGK